jgi:hypothetical protein
MSDFSEEINPDDYAIENPVTVTTEEKTLVDEFIKGSTLEESAEAAGMDYHYAVQLMARPDVVELIKVTQKNMKNIGEIQKREGVEFLKDVKNVVATEFYSDEGDLNFKALKEARVPVESIKIRKDAVGNIVSHDIKFYSAMDAVKTAAKFQGWEAPKQVEVSGYIGGLTPDILNRIEEIEIEAEVIEDDDEDEEDEILKQLLG